MNGDEQRYGFSLALVEDLRFDEDQSMACANCARFMAQRNLQACSSAS
jgi:hypothetical protein